MFQDYISCAEVWIEYVAKSFGVNNLQSIDYVGNV